MCLPYLLEMNTNVLLFLVQFDYEMLYCNKKTELEFHYEGPQLPAA